MHANVASCFVLITYFDIKDKERKKKKKENGKSSFRSLGQKDNNI